MATEGRGEVLEALVATIYHALGRALSGTQLLADPPTPSMVRTGPLSRTFPVLLQLAWLPPPPSSPWLTSLASGGQE